MKALARAMLALAFALVLLPSCGPDNRGKAGGPGSLWKSEPVPLGRLSGVVEPLRYHLELAIDPAKDRFSGRTTITIKLYKALSSFYLHGQALHVTQVSLSTVGGKSIGGRYTQVNESGVARVDLDSEAPAGAAVLKLVYDSAFNTSLDSLYKVLDAGVPYAFTQFESTSARGMFPCFDEPAFKTPFEISVTSPSSNAVISNSPVASQRAAGSGLTQTTFAPTNPLPTYLVALAVGPLDVVDGGTIAATAERKQPIPVRGITTKGKGALIRYALSFTPKIVQALEKYYGVAYPFQKLDILAVPDFAAGAMENAGAITFRERLLLMTRDAPFDQRRSSVEVQAHELAHQWFGDLVTPQWWDDVWLNESFADWMEYKASAMVEPDWEFDRGAQSDAITAMDVDELSSARKIHQPIKINDDIENAFDSITYDKGGAVLSMFENYLGEEKFRIGIHAYLRKYAGKNASAHDFVATVADATAHPEIVRAFDDFIDKTGIPYIKASLTCPAGMPARLDLSQSTYSAIGIALPQKVWHVPMCISRQGAPRLCRIGDAVSVSLELGAKCPDWLNPNADAHGYYRFTLDQAGWHALIKNGAVLGAGDQLALISNASAAFGAGNLDAATFLAGYGAVAPTARYDAIDAMRTVLHGLRQKLVAPADLHAYRSLVSRMFGMRLAQTGLGARPDESAGDTLSRVHLAELMVEEARDPAVSAALSRAASRIAATGGADSGGISPDLKQEAMRAGVLVQGTGFARRLQDTLVNSKDEYFRRTVLYAIAGSEDPAFLARFYNLVFSPSLRTGEIRYLYQYSQEEPVARGVLWQWLKAHFDGVVKRVSRFGMGRAFDIQGDACDAATKGDFIRFFSPKLKDIPGAARRFELTKEKMTRCIALKTSRASEFARALQAAVR